MKTYKDIYEFPLKTNMGGYILDNKNQIVAQFEFYDSLLQQNIIDVLNDKDKPTKGKRIIHKNHNMNDYILIRGWGNLTGIGGHNLKPEEAANIQDTFAEFIINKLNKEIT